MKTKTEIEDEIDKEKETHRRFKMKKYLKLNVDGCIFILVSIIAFVNFVLFWIFNSFVYLAFGIFCVIFLPFFRFNGGKK